jgi:YD repeat-containing protein
MGRNYRKLIGVILCIAMFLGILPNTSMQAEQVFTDDTAVSDDTVFVGDVDGDGTVTPKDVTKMRRFLAGGWDVEVATEDGDVDEDGSITPKDVTKLRRYLAGGWGVELPKKSDPVLTLPPLDELIAPDTESPLGKGKWSVLDVNSISDGWSKSVYYKSVYEVETTNGKILIFETEEGDGDLISWTDRVEYDDAGKIISERFRVNSNPSYRDFITSEAWQFGINEMWLFYTYDEEGKLIERTHADNYRRIIWKESYEYDQNGKLDKKTRKTMDDEEEPLVFSFNYNETDQLVKEEIREGNELKSIIFYDEDGTVNKTVSMYLETNYEFSSDKSEVVVNDTYRNDRYSGNGRKYALSYKDGYIYYDVYDENGNRSTKAFTEYNSLGQMNSFKEFITDYKGETYEYTREVYRQHDNDGALIKEVMLTKGRSGYYSAYTYEKNDKVLSEKYYSEEKLSEESNYTLDDADRLIEKNGDSRYRYVYEYDEHGNMIKMLCYFKSPDELYYTYDYKYDANGRLIWTHSSFGSTYAYEYEENGCCMERIAPVDRETSAASGDGSSIETETYDNESVYTYYYDMDGAIVKISMLRENGSEIVFERECDSNGNVIKQPVKKDVLCHRSYYYPDIELQDSEGNMIKKARNTGYVYELSKSDDNSELLTTYYDSRKEKEKYYNEEKQLIEYIEYYSYDNSKYDYKYFYDEGRKIKELWTYTRDDYTELGGSTYEPDDYGFLVPYDINRVNEQTVPDSNFRQFLYDNYDLDKDGYLSHKEITDITNLEIGNKDIADLTGIEILTELKSIDCEGNPLKVIDVSYKIDADIAITCNEDVSIIYAVPVDETHFPDNNFRMLVSSKYDRNNNGYLQGNELNIDYMSVSRGWYSDIDSSYSNLYGISYFWNLKELYGDDCYVDNLDLSGCDSLETINFEDYVIRQIDLSSCKKLKNAKFTDGNIKCETISFSANTELEELNLWETGVVRNIDISGCTKLEKLDISYTGILKIDVSNNPLLTPENIICDKEDEDDPDVEIIWS